MPDVFLCYRIRYNTAARSCVIVGRKGEGIVQGKDGDDEVEVDARRSRSPRYVLAD